MAVFPDKGLVRLDLSGNEAAFPDKGLVRFNLSGNFMEYPDRVLFGPRIAIGLCVNLE
jgi:hypothetical protein